MVGETLSGASTAAALAVMRRKEAALRALGQVCGATGVISEVRERRTDVYVSMCLSMVLDSRDARYDATPIYPSILTHTTTIQKQHQKPTQAYLGFPSLLPAITAILQQGGDREAAVSAPRRRACPTGARVLPLLLPSAVDPGAFGGGGGGGYYHQTLREEALRAVGVLGALSPALYAEIAAAAAADGGAASGGGSGGDKGGGGDPKGGAGGGGGAAAAAAGRLDLLLLTPIAPEEDDDEEDDDGAMEGEGEGGEQEEAPALLPLETLYPSVAARALLGVLGDPQAPAQHPAALSTLMAIARLALRHDDADPSPSVGGSGSSNKARRGLVRLLVRGFGAAMRRGDATVEFKVRLHG